MARRASPTAKLLRMSWRQLAGLGVVGALGVLGGLDAALSLGERLARLAHRKPSGGGP